MHSIDVLRQLESTPLFGGLKSCMAEAMLSSMSCVRWRKQSKVMSPAETAEKFFVILRGRVKVSRFSESTGRELTLILLRPGDAFDVTNLLSDQSGMATARTLEEVVALTAPIASWRAWIEQDRSLRHAVDRYVAEQLRSLAHLAAGLSLHTTLSRLAQLLLRESAGGDGSALAEVGDLSHEELACLIGSARVVVTRLLARLKHEGAIDTNGRSIRILNRGCLHQHAHGNDGPPNAWHGLVVL